MRRFTCLFDSRRCFQIRTNPRVPGRLAVNDPNSGSVTLAILLRAGGRDRLATERGPASAPEARQRPTLLRQQPIALGGGDLVARAKLVKVSAWFSPERGSAASDTRFGPSSPWAPEPSQAILPRAPHGIGGGSVLVLVSSWCATWQHWRYAPSDQERIGSPARFAVAPLSYRASPRRDNLGWLRWRQGRF